MRRTFSSPICQGNRTILHGQHRCYAQICSHRMYVQGPPSLHVPQIPPRPSNVLISAVSLQSHQQRGAHSVTPLGLPTKHNVMASSSCPLIQPPRVIKWKNGAGKLHLISSTGRKAFEKLYSMWKKLLSVLNEAQAQSRKSRNPWFILERIQENPQGRCAFFFPRKA